MSKCEHEGGIILLYSSNFRGCFLWCERCKNVWPDFGVWKHRKKAEKVAKGNHLEIQAREESIFVKKKVGEKNG